MSEEDRRKHLEMIQGVITRLAGNSFTIKGWAVALIAVLGGFAAKDADVRFASALFFPALCFWGLDAWYLRRERLYRKLYEKVAARTSGIADFSMDASPYETEVEGIFRTAFSPTIRWLHVPIVMFVMVLLIYAARR